ncbi:MAG TPA: hypothetical protein VFU41_08065 [Gemmatimonadales bacterium]|nr:hypothetical protein [Gemmatimonadales bacterium]
MIRRAVTSIPFLAAALGGTIVLSATPDGAAMQRHEPRPRRVTFENTLAGVAPDGQGSVWEGSAGGAIQGRVRVEQRQVEGPSEAANPVWHVVAQWSVTDASGARSFDAQLEGMVDWRTGMSRLSGVITQGWMQGAWVQQESRFVNGDATGSLTIAPEVARR